MVARGAPVDIVNMTASRTGAVPSQRTSCDVIDLHVRRMGGEQAVQVVAKAPIRHIPAALLEALQGSWGSPEQIGLAPSRPRHLHLVAG